MEEDAKHQEKVLESHVKRRLRTKLFFYYTIYLPILYINLSTISYAIMAIIYFLLSIYPISDII